MMRNTRRAIVVLTLLAGAGALPRCVAAQVAAVGRVLTALSAASRGAQALEVRAVVSASRLTAAEQATVWGALRSGTVSSLESSLAGSRWQLLLTPVVLDRLDVLGIDDGAFDELYPALRTHRGLYGWTGRDDLTAAALTLEALGIAPDDERIGAKIDGVVASGLMDRATADRVLTRTRLEQAFRVGQWRARGQAAARQTQFRYFASRELIPVARVEQAFTTAVGRLDRRDLAQPFGLLSDLGVLSLDLARNGEPEDIVRRIVNAYQTSRHDSVKQGISGVAQRIERLFSVAYGTREELREAAREEFSWTGRQRPKPQALPRRKQLPTASVETLYAKAAAENVDPEWIEWSRRADQKIRHLLGDSLYGPGVAELSTQLTPAALDTLVRLPLGVAPALSSSSSWREATRVTEQWLEQSRGLSSEEATDRLHQLSQGCHLLSDRLTTADSPEASPH